MNFLPNGKMQFDDMYEMYFQLFTEIGLGINPQQYLFDQDTGIVIRFKDKYIKATINPGEVIYSGKTDIVFEPAKNYQLMVSLFGYYMDKEINSGESNIHYIAQFIEDDKTREKQRVVVRTATGDITSEFYRNIYLGYIEIIFNLSGHNIDLSNFDYLIEI